MNKIVLLSLFFIPFLSHSQNDFREKYVGYFTDGDDDPIYLENEDGSVDSSFSYCYKVDFQTALVNDTLWFEIQVCNATYHSGYVSGPIHFKDKEHGEFRWTDGEDKCAIDFYFSEETIDIKEVSCTYFHGARASFDATVSRGGDNFFSEKNQEAYLRNKTVEYFNYFNSKQLEKLIPWYHKGAMISKIDVDGTVKSFPPDGMLGLKKIPEYEEKIDNIVVQVNENMASVWMDFWFYLGDSLSHCGVNQVLWSKSLDGTWKIVNTTYNSHHNCADIDHLAWESEKGFSGDILSKSLTRKLDTWHKAAADANLNSYFDFMLDESVFMGTDATENWTKKEFYDFSKPYFDKGKAWTFTGFNRHFYFNESRTLAWFDEELNTWMGTCRGSGVMKLTQDGWKLLHYNLSLPIPNDDMSGVIELLKKK